MRLNLTSHSLYDFKDYRDYLTQVLKTDGKKRGYRTELARAAGCHNSFFSQVLKQSVQLLPEHAYGLARFWEMSESETEYFVLLVQLARTGNPSMKKWIEEKMFKIRESSDSLKNHLTQFPALADKMQDTYYSSWDYSAIHILTGIAKFQSIRAISGALKLSEERVKLVLADLEKFKLIRKEKGDRCLSISSHIHLPSNTHLVANQHLQWRMRNSQEINENRSNNLHFTGVHSVSHEDAKRFRKMLAECLEKISQLSRPSPEEELIVITCDFTRMTETKF